MLWPRGAKTMEDVPAELLGAIDHALLVLNWHENSIDKEEIPPQWMWHLDWELKDWWKKVEERRKDKYSGHDDSEKKAILEDREENVFAERFK